MEQIARECGIALVSYTITHHTRQSAIGLPFIVEKDFGGEKKAVTEYTDFLFCPFYVHLIDFSFLGSF